MSFGFNTDVRIGEQVFHVQTEDRGPAKPIIDTGVYQNGRVLHRRSSNYEEFAASAGFTPEALRQRVEEQHRSVIEDLRSGGLKSRIDFAGEPASQSGGIEVQLLNPGSWLTAGTVSLDVEILRRSDKQPETGAQVEAVIEGALRDTPHSATTDCLGRVKIQFPLPQLGKGDLALIIHATTQDGTGEIRFIMRSRANSSEAGAIP
jgi:hypothetical protein